MMNKTGNEGHQFGIPVNVGGNDGPTSTGGPVNLSQQHVQNQVNTSLQKQSQQAQQRIPQQLQQQVKQQGSTHNQSIQQQQQNQRILLQQRALQRQQQLQNYENQFYQLLMTLNKKPKRLYNFVEDTDSILKKYEQYRPSFEFHIYENNYKICAPANTKFIQQSKTPEISNDGLVLNKNNETLKEFLEYVARGRIPEAIMEVLRDCNIQFYESNLILQVYDHTNTVEVQPKENTSVETTAAKPESNSTNPANQSNVPESAEQPKTKPPPFKRPRVYRTLLRPNDLTLYYDMMTYADQARFSDSIYLQLESEILNLTKRNIKLDVNLNPFENRDKLDDCNFTAPTWSEEMSEVKFCHRKESARERTKGVVKFIEQHEEIPQHSSNYEQMMLIMSERTTTTTSSTFAASLAKHEVNGSSNNLSGGRVSSSLSGASGHNSNNISSGNQVAIAAAAAAAAAVSSNNENNQFSRLKFIEQWRVNKEKRKQQQALNAAIAPTSFNTRISMTAPLTQQQLQQQQLQQLQQNQKGTNQKTNNKRANAGDKPKAKKPRKTKKADGEPKKKRVPKKKQTNNTATPSNNNGTPQ